MRRRVRFKYLGGFLGIEDVDIARSCTYMILYANDGVCTLTSPVKNKKKQTNNSVGG